MPQTGEVCAARFSDQAPRKYVICVDPEEGLYLLINSRRYNERTDISVDRTEIGVLSHESYIETGDLYCILSEDILAIYESIGWELRQRICRAIQEHGVLAPMYMRPVLCNLCGIDVAED